MASGLQCPGCGHVHPAGLPEIARGDATFRCYGCYRTLSVPDGWTGRATPRPPAGDVSLTGDAPPGAGTRDARSARLAGRGRSRASALTGQSPAAPPADLPTQMVPSATPDGPAVAGPPTADWSAAGTGPPADRTAGGAGAAGWTGREGAGTADGRSGDGAAVARPGAAPLGWVAPRRSGTPVPTGIRAVVWVAAFWVGLVLTAFTLRKMGILDVDRVIDLYAGSGPGRFGILLVLLPMWALLSATIAHFSLEALARRRRPRRAAPRPQATTSQPS